MMIKKHEIKILKDLSEIIINEFDNNSEIVRRSIYRNKNIPNPHFTMIICIMKNRYDILIKLYNMFKDRLSDRTLDYILNYLSHKPEYNVMKIIIKDRPRLFSSILNPHFITGSNNQSHYLNIIDNFIKDDIKISDIIDSIIKTYHRRDIECIKAAIKHIACNYTDLIDDDILLLMFRSGLRYMIYGMAYIKVMR
ncbi:MAG: hypothetical protein QXD03_03235 [Candidatus Anstonellales archaeon]